MAKERKAHVVYYEPRGGASESLETLNALLNDGWLPVQTAAMGGAAAGPDVQAGFAALVILERQRDHAVSGFGS